MTVNAAARLATGATTLSSVSSRSARSTGREATLARGERQRQRLDDAIGEVVLQAEQIADRRLRKN